MKKIPTIFDRDWEGNCGVINKPMPECDWVFRGEGVATEKIDGTNIKVEIENGEIINVWKRRNPNREQKERGIEPWYVDASEDDSQDKHIFKAIDNADISDIPDGKYSCEAYGGKIQGNPLFVDPDLYFFIHRPLTLPRGIKREYDWLKKYLPEMPTRILLSSVTIEGIVFHHPDGRMAKIKRKDFK